MSPERQRVVIAELCGWSDIGDSQGLLMGCRPGFKTIRNPVPNYLGDLNAMHEAEKLLLSDSTLQDSA